MARWHGAATLRPLQAPPGSSNWGGGPDGPLPKAAESCPASLSMEGIFRVLATIPRDRLVHFKHKLSCRRQDGKSCRLLHAMILLTLGRETEASLLLEPLENCAAVADIYKSHRRSTGASKAEAAPSKQDADVVLAAAWIYSLLAEEELCGPLARDEAYGTSIKAFLERDVSRPALESPLREAELKCGLDFGPASSNLSNAGDSSSGAAKSSPVTIPISWAPSEIQPLCSTGGPVTLLSHLEISQSPTVPFLTCSVQHDTPEDSSQCGSGPDSPGAAGATPVGSCSGRPAEPTVGDEERTKLAVSPGGNLSVHPPHKITEPVEGGGNREPQSLVPSELDGWARGLLQNPQVPSTPLPGLEPSALFVPKTIEDSSFPKQSLETESSSSSGLPPRLSGPLSTDLPAEEEAFFTFVVVHAPEDETVACRVRERLESLGIGDGATVSEDFLVPGRCQLSCFQDALDNSAFTLLLLTENFKGRLCSFQANMALMDSFRRFCKANTVVPFIAKESPVKRGDMPCLLAAIVPLDETSPVFARRVKKTFSPAAIQGKRALWDISRQIRKQERLRELQSVRNQALRGLSAARLSPQAPTPSPGVFPGLRPTPEQGSRPFFYPEMAQPQLGPEQPYIFSRGSSGLVSGVSPSHVIIQNAQMVQIGDYNQMQVEKEGSEEEGGGLGGR